jgi:branched-chain amino acid transport system permease protein
MRYFIGVIVSGLADGSVYGALALALVLVFRATGIINFAQASMATVMTFVMLEFVLRGIPIVLALLIAMLLSLVAGAGVERILIRPVEGRSPLTIVILTVGISVVLDSLALTLWGGDNRPFPSLFGTGSFSVAGAPVSFNSMGTGVILLAAAGLISLLLQRTDIGLAIRAGATDPEVARLLGVRVNRTLMLGWGIASVMGTLAGALIAAMLYLDVTVMPTVLIYALAAACLGGFDSLGGALIAGWIVGLAEGLTTAYVSFIGSDLRVLVPLTIIVVVLLARPNGLFGSRQLVRA